MIHGACELVRPANLAAALVAKSERPDLRVLAGGTDLMVLFELGVDMPAAVLDIWGLAELQGIEEQGEALRIGALATYTDLMRHPVVRERLPILAAASAEVGAVQIQNRGTLGGNVVNASPAADGVPPLLAFDAELEIASARGLRRRPLNGFYTGYKQMDLSADELLVAIHIPLPAPDSVQWFRKVGTRRAQSIAKVVAAATARRSGDVLSNVRIALGSVGPTILRLPKTESLLQKRALCADLVEEVRRSARDEVTPIDDVRSSADYRRTVSGNIVARWVAELVGSAG